jgi:outer membrane protein assembly factor BamB
MLAVDVSSMTDAWRIQTDDSAVFYAATAVDDEHAVFITREGVVHCLRAGDGSSAWTHDADAGVDSSPVIVGGRVFFGSKDGIAHALALADGQPVWRFEAGASIVASPAVGQGCLVIGSADGALYCFGAHEGGT